jgi:hypothetical protein
MQKQTKAEEKIQKAKEAFDFVLMLVQQLKVALTESEKPIFTNKDYMCCYDVVYKVIEENTFNNSQAENTNETEFFKLYITIITQHLNEEIAVLEKQDDELSLAI